jgi:prevent-host-death family protein
MHEVGAFEAKNTLGSLLDRVEKGEEVVITRRGKRIARLVPDSGTRDREKARRAVEAIMEMRKGVTLGGLKIKDLINEGRLELGHRQFDYAGLVFRRRDCRGFG